jgi:hypothetical protein
MDEFASRNSPVRENMRFQRRSWIVERVGWAVLLAVALLGLSGVFGTGPLSWAKVSSGSLSVEYDRFQRVTRLARFTFGLRAQHGPDARLHLSSAFQRNFEISNVQPQPARSSAGPDGVDLQFATGGASGGRIVIWAHSRHYGISDIKARLGNGAPLSFWVFVYP